MALVISEELALTEQVLTFAGYVDWLNAVLRDNPHAAQWEMPADTPTPAFHGDGTVSLEAPPVGFSFRSEGPEPD